jgi:hypothetical protein
VTDFTPYRVRGLHVVENVVIRSGRRTRLGVRGFEEGEFEGDSPAYNAARGADFGCK